MLLSREGKEGLSSVSGTFLKSMEALAAQSSLKGGCSQAIESSLDMLLAATMLSLDSPLSSLTGVLRSNGISQNMTF